MAGLEKIVSSMAWWHSLNYGYNQLETKIYKKGLKYYNSATDYGIVKSFIIFEAHHKSLKRPDVKVYIMTLLHVEERYEQEENRSCIIVAVRDNNISYVTFTEHRNVPNVLSRIYSPLSINNTQGGYFFIMDEEVPNTFKKEYKDHIVAVVMHNTDIIWSKQ